MNVSAERYKELLEAIASVRRMAIYLHSELHDLESELSLLACIADNLEEKDNGTEV